MKSFTKIKPLRSERYKQFIRSKPCIDCGKTANIEADHDTFGRGIMGGKPPDLQTLPRCRGCHNRKHNQGRNLSAERLYEAVRCLEYINEFFSMGNKL